MIDVTNLNEIFDHLKAHPAMSLYQTCPCGIEIVSYETWIEHAIIPLITDAVIAGYNAGLNHQGPQDIPTNADLDDMITSDIAVPFTPEPEGAAG